MNLNCPRFISIALSPALVKVAQVSRGGVVEKIAKRPVDKNGQDIALRQALSGFQTKNAGILCTVPGDVTTTKNIEVPSVDPGEIESILALQASRHTPFSKDEILTGYIRLGSPRPNFTRLLLVVVKRETVKEKLMILKTVGLTADTVIFVPEAVACFYAKALNARKTDAPVALLDVRVQNTSFIVLAQGTAVMSRNIPVGIEHLAVDADAGKHLTDEIRASMDAYTQEGIGAALSKFCLTTSHPGLAGVDAMISQAVGVKVAASPYVNFVKSSRLVRDAIARDFADDSALDVIAAGVMASRCQADLVPQEIRDQRTVAEKGRETLKAGILVLLSLFLVGAGLLSKVYFKDQFLKQGLIAGYAEQRQEVKNLESMISRTRTLWQYLEERNMPLEAVRELFRIVPEEIYLTGVNMDQAGDFSVQGVSESMSRVFSFVTALENSPLFESVKTKSTASKKERGKDVATFEIVMKLVREAGPASAGQPDAKK